jgi:hypothetical protein
MYERVFENKISGTQHHHALTITNPRPSMKMENKDGIHRRVCQNHSRFRGKIAALCSKIGFRDRN